MKFTTVTAIANDWLSEMDYHGKIREEVLFRYINNAAEMLISSELLSYKLGILDVTNFRAKVDPNLHSPTLVACVDNRKQYINRGVIKSYTKDVFGTDCEIEVNLNCPSCHKEACGCPSPVIEIDIDETYLATHPYLKEVNNKSMIGWAAVQDDGFPTHNYFSGFQIMKPRASNQVLWNAEFFLGKCNLENLPYNYSYEIDNGEFITDLEEGQVIIAYLAYKKDSNGYYMIPNNVWAVEAIKDFVTASSKWAEWMKGDGNQNDRLRWLDAKNQSMSRLVDARNRLELPTAEKWHRTMSERWTVPIDRYYYQ